MAKTVTLNGITYSLTGSNNLIAKGPGIYGSGISIGNLNSVDVNSFKNSASSPNVEAPAKETLLNFTESDLQVIKDALSPPPPPPPTPQPPDPTPPAATEQQNKTYVASGGADDESGKTSASNTDDGTPAAASITLGGSNATEGDEALAATQRAMDAESAYSEMFGATPATSGTTVAGKSDTPQAKKTASPGRRLKNPLSDFSSVNYQISLYMITPDAYNAFITSGRKDINALANVANTEYAQQSYAESSSGVYLIAQSGGINNKNSNRAPGFEYDFYIDNLNIKSAISMGKSTNSEGPVNTNNFKFQIIEPYGFSFVTKLKNAQNALQKYVSSLPNVDKNPFADRQTYILGIRFLGYDSQGSLVNNSNGSFETFYDIKMTQLKFKLDGKAVVYDIEAVACSVQEGMGLSNGRILTDTTVVGSTVEETINSLVNNLNKAQNDLKDKKGCEIPNVYKVVYVGSDADNLKLASVVNQIADSDKTKYPALNVIAPPPTVQTQRTTPTTGSFARMDRNPSSSTSSDQINERTAITSRVDNNQRQLVFKGAGSTPIAQAIQTIVTQSEYIQKAIINLYQNQPEPDRQTDDYQTADSNSNKQLKWVNVSTEVKNLGYDRIRHNWAYEITYVVQTYSTPFVTVTVAPNVTPYYGPVKRYEYWLTGNNTEVLRFELQYNQLYQTIGLANLDKQIDLVSPIPVMVGHRVAAPRQGRLGPGLESQNAYVNNLNDPGAYASAKITIMGDPDWLVQDSTSTVSTINNIYDRFYGINGYTINCNNGQVFIEVDIKEAVDYDNTTGLLSINDKILFFDYPKIYKEGPNKIQGISFLVTDVEANFRNGKFEQTLTLNAGLWADPNNTSAATSAAQREPASTGSFARMDRSAAASEGGTNNTSTPAGTKTTGFTNEPPAPGMKRNEETGDWYNPLSNLGAPVTRQATSPTGSRSKKRVADDDASNKPSKNPSNNYEGRPTYDNLSDIVGA